MKLSKINSVIEAPQGVYEIRHTDTGKFYVGSSVNLRKRWNRHIALLRDEKHDNVHLQRAWDMCGAGAFEFSVLEYVPDKKDLIAREQYWFDRLGASRYGYNLSPIAGNRLGMRHSEETKRKISASGKGRVVTDETRERMSAAFRLRTMSAEARAKISAARRGQKCAPEHVAKREATKARNRLGKAHASQPNF